MSRSVKKGPYVQASLLKKIEALNAAQEKKVVKIGPAAPRFSLISWVTPLLSMMAANMCLCISPKIWSAIN